MDNLKDKMRGLIRSKHEEILKLASNLVKIRSENPPGDVDEISSFVNSYLEKHGLSAENYEVSKGKINIVSRLGGKNGKTLLLNGHMDTVPAGDPARWSFPPFIGKIANGVLYGRGSVDMKSGLSAIISSLVLLADFEKELNGSLVLAAVCDEETGGKFGTKWLLDNNKISGDCCIVGEPTLVNLCVIGEKGIYRARLKTNGVPAHGSRPMLGKNAILIMMNVIQAVQKLYHEKIDMPTDLKDVIEASKQAVFRATKNEEAKNVMDHYTVNVGLIKGGTKINVVPESCTIDVDIRIPLSVSTSDAIFRLKTLLAEIAEEIEIENMRLVEPSFTSPDLPLITFLNRNATEIIGTPIKAIMMPGATDAKHLRINGVPSISFGPGNTFKYAHAYDEQVPTEQIVQATEIYACTALDYLRM